VTPSETAAVRFLVSGRVQGVGFRWWVVRRAQEIGGMQGWARNLVDGRVEVVASGPPASVRALEAFLERGPRMARVDNVEKGDSPHDVGDLKAFTVR
jgi:acylphosphatase